MTKPHFLRIKSSFLFFIYKPKVKIKNNKN